MELESRTLVDMVNMCLASARETPIFAYPREKHAQSGFRYWTGAELGLWTRKAAAFYASEGLQPRRAGERPKVVALFGYRTPEWAATYYTVIRMGHTAFLVAPRIVHHYVTKLLDMSKADILIKDESIPLPIHPIKTIPMVTEQLLDADPPTIENNEQLFCPPSAVHSDDVVNINHSSGTTSCPKLIPSTHSEYMKSARLIAKDYPRDKRVWIASAMYHAAGLRRLHFLLYGHAPSFFDNDRVPFTTTTVIDFLRETQAEEVWLTPYTLTLASQTAKGLELLRKADVVRSFGAVLPDSVGNRLVEHGVNLTVDYGMTETRLLMWSRGRAADDKDWDYMFPLPQKAAHLYMRPVPEQEGYFELICLPSCPDVLEHVRAKDGSFATGDLLMKHPTRPDRWKIVGRRDDQIKVFDGVRLTVVNANVYEQKLLPANNDSAIHEIVLFGQGRNKLGLLVFTDTDIAGSEVVRQRVWAKVEDEINGKLPLGICRDMIIVIDANRSTLPQTTKQNLIRSRVILEYEDEIERAYRESATAPRIRGGARADVSQIAQS